MLKKTITFNDFEGVPHTEDFYFHLSKAELAEMKLVWGDGMEDYIKQIIADQDGAAVIKLFKEIISKSFGVKSADGKHFRKNEQDLQDFFDCGAYSELFMELVTSADAGASFINGIIPADLRTNPGQEVIPLPGEPQDDKPFVTRSVEELLAMSKADFDREFAKVSTNAPKHVLLAAMQRRDSE